jgi:small subunit ribosomal protein S20
MEGYVNLNSTIHLFRVENSGDYRESDLQNGTPSCFSLQYAGNIRIISKFSAPDNSGIFMANSAQARKRARQNVAQRDRNMSLRSQLRTAIKHARKAISSSDKSNAQTVFQESVAMIDSIADKGIIHKNKASRHKSRLSAAIGAMA